MSQAAFVFVAKELVDGPEQQALEVTVCIHPQVLCSFIGSPTGQLPTEFQPLVRPIDQECYTRVAAVTPTMKSVLWQVLRCPYQGMTKWMYLEGKALELASLVMEQEMEILDGTILPHSLKPDVVDRVHHARDILLQRLDNPPSLMELARQVVNHPVGLGCLLCSTANCSRDDFVADLRVGCGGVMGLKRSAKL